MDYKSYFKFFEKCHKNNQDYMMNILKGGDITRSYGCIVDNFLNDESEEKNILHDLETKIEDTEFKSFFMSKKKILLKKEEKNLINKIIKSTPPDIISLLQLKLNIEQQNYSFIDWKNHYESQIKALEFLARKKAKSTLFFLQDLYDSYFLDKFKNGENSQFEEYYKNDDRNILGTENYRKYGLIQCTSDFILKDGLPPKIEDTKRSTHLLVEYIPTSFVTYLMNEKKSFEFDLALRPNYDICDDGLRNISLLLESTIHWNDYEYGLKKIPPVTKFYDDKKHNDFIVIQNDSEGVTFEEILEDFDIIDEDIVVTQGVHFIYKDNTISHLDHEFFFYSSDDFLNKEKDLRQKGTARKRFKTFKIDNAKIPFEEEAEKNIVYKTLHTFFKKHKLIDEVFEKLH